MEKPYAVDPEYLSIPGFDLKMVQPDLLHICHLGTARDLIGSAMRELTMTSVLFIGRTQLLRLRDATSRLKEYAGATGHSLGIRRLSSTSLGFSDKGYPELKGKGYDSFVVLSWLVSEVMAAPPAGHELLCTSLWCLDSFLSVATNAGRFFTNAEVQHLQSVGQLFLRSYLHLAVQALQRGRKLYRIRPKFHLLTHMMTDFPPSQSNFCYHSTWQDADVNKVVMTVKKKTHKRNSTASTLKRWLLALPGHFKHATSVRKR